MHVYGSGESARTRALTAMALAAVVLAIGINAVFAYFTFIPAWLYSAPAVTGAFGLLYLVMDRWAWKWPLVRGLGLVETPDIEGVYSGDLTSTYSGGTTRPVKVCIDQTWTKIAVRFQVLEPTTSTSDSLTARLKRTGHDTTRLTYTYRNQVRPGIAGEDMNDHDGTAELEIQPDGAVEGRYYNYRGNQGTLVLQRVKDPTPS